MEVQEKKLFKIITLTADLTNQTSTIELMLLPNTKVSDNSWEELARREIAKKLTFEPKSVDLKWYFHLENSRNNLADFSSSRYLLVANVTGGPNLAAQIEEKKEEIQALQQKLHDADADVWTKARTKEITQLTNKTDQCEDMEKVCKLVLEWLGSITPLLKLPEKVSSKIMALVDRVLGRIATRSDGLPPQELESLTKMVRELKEQMREQSDINKKQAEINVNCSHKIISLEATITELNEKLSKKDKEIEELKNTALKQDARIADLENNNENYRKKFVSHSLRNLWQSFLYKVIRAVGLHTNKANNYTPAGTLLKVIQENSQTYAYVSTNDAN